MSLAPLTPAKKQIAADGTITERTEGERRLAEWRVNWFAYICFADAAASFGWTVYLVSVGIVHIVRAKTVMTTPPNKIRNVDNLN